jgi:hypothetical protein
MYNTFKYSFNFKLSLRKNAFCVVEGAQLCFAHAPTALNEINLAIAPPFVGQMKKNLHPFFPHYLGHIRPRNHLTLLSL